MMGSVGGTDEVDVGVEIEMGCVTLRRVPPLIPGVIQGTSPGETGFIKCV